MTKNLSIVVLLIFGILYSIYLSFYLGSHTGFIFILITIGLAGTIYLVDKKVDYKIILYVWIAIIVVAAIVLLIELIFQFALLLRE